MGLEPTRSCDHRHLKPARLPIPPLLHIRFSQFLAGRAAQQDVSYQHSFQKSTPFFRFLKKITTVWILRKKG